MNLIEKGDILLFSPPLEMNVNLTLSGWDSIPIKSLIVLNKEMLGTDDRSICMIEFMLPATSERMTVTVVNDDNFFDILGTHDITYYFFPVSLPCKKDILVNVTAILLKGEKVFQFDSDDSPRKYRSDGDEEYYETWETHSRDLLDEELDTKYFPR